MHPLISIVIPVLNEKENIEQTIAAIETSLQYPYELFIVYDFPEDNTIPVVKRLIENYKSIKLIYNKKGGLINAVKRGVEVSQGMAVTIMSPDSADNPATINRMYKKIKEGYDIVCASRYSKGGKRINQNSLKMLLSKTAGKLTPFALGIPTSDITNGYKMYRKSILKKIPIKSNGGWEFALELVIKANNLGFKITEVGSVSRNRKFGTSKFKLFQWLPKYIYWYLYGVSLRLKNLRVHIVFF